jgi:DNA-binding SARP family transcriptional activator/tRNA A-37 threonylcarbamoyl transferase component Bud32
MIEFRALGPVELTSTDGRALDAVLAPKRLALLAYLAIGSPPQFRRRDTIVAYLWPELDADHARAALRQTIHFLRQSLGPTVLTSRGEEDVGLDRDQLWCDTTAFDRACADAQSSRALDLYRGDLLPGFFATGAAPEYEQWLDAERDRLRRQASAAAWMAVEHAAAAGQHAAAGQFARRAAALAPDDENALRRLIRVMDELGDRSGAVRAYDEFARRLAREYEAEPSVQTKALIEAVRSRAHRDAPLLASPDPSTSAHPGGPSDRRVAEGGTTPFPDSRSRGSPRPALHDLFVLERQIGTSGLATVYHAREIKHERRVLLKVLYPSLAAVLGPERFRREIHILSQLQHPGIHALYDSGEASDALYYVMPRLEGESLKTRLAQGPRVAISDVVSIVCDVADAVAYAHAHGVVHRDLKPDSILLAGGRAIVTDFGIARAISRVAGDRLTETGVVLGTPTYMSPEQAGGVETVDERSDVYSLACVVYEMLAGNPPYTAPTRMKVITQHLRAAVPRLSERNESVPPAIADVVAKALAKPPGRRYATVTAFGAALRAASAPAVRDRDEQRTGRRQDR